MTMTPHLNKVFSTKLRLKPCLWLGCRVKDLMLSESGRIWLISFDNFPWRVSLDRVSARILAERLYGPDYWAPAVNARNLVRPGDLFCVSVRSVEHDSKTYIESRLVL